MMRILRTGLLIVLISMCATMSVKSTALRTPQQHANVASGATRRLYWQDGGHKLWQWKGHSINYISPHAFGDDPSSNNKPSLLLIHGFGASAFHWRYNIPHLSHKYNVYALDLLGFGLSDKPLIDYSVEVWKDQVLSFLREVVNKERTAPCVVAGNSLGGSTALYAAASEEATKSNLISGCILLNAACTFRPPTLLPENRVESPAWVQNATAKLQKLLIGLSFMYTKQPARIAQVLRQIYPSDPDKVDAELVESIRVPSLHPNAAEVFYRVVAKNGNGPPVFADDLLAQLKVPLMLVWGSKDPWIRPQAADRIQALFPAAQRVDLDAGHCPHDEVPVQVNAAIDQFMHSLHPPVAPAKAELKVDAGSSLLLSHSQYERAL